MLTPMRGGFALRPVHLALAGLVASATFCAHFPLMAFYRKVFQSKYPEAAQGWTNDGSFASVGSRYPFLPEEAAHAARVRRAAEGLPYDGFIRENRGARYLSIDFLNFLALGTLQRATGDIHTTFLLARLIFGALWLPLLYLIARKILDADEAALFFAVFVTFFSYLLTGMFLSAIPWSELFSLKGVAKSAWTLASYGRTESLLRLPRPGITYAGLFAASLLTLRALKSKETRDLALAGCAAGLLAYVHLDVWTTHLGACFVLGAMESVRLRTLRHALWIPAGAGLAVSLPWLALNFPADPELLSRAATFTRMPDPYSLIYLAAFAAIRRRWGETRPPGLMYLAAFMLSLVLLLNVQLVTGYSLERSHWYWFGNIYLILAGLAFMRKDLLSARGWLPAAGVLWLAVLLQNFAYAAIHYPSYGYPKAVEEPLVWLNERASTDEVVASLDYKAVPLIAANTPCKTLLPYGNPIHSDVPVRDIGARIRRGAELYGIPLSDFLAKTDLLSSASLERSAFLGPATPDEMVREALKEDAPVRGEFRVDYLWVGPLERELLKGSPPTGADPEPVFSNGRVAIYRTISPKEAA